MKLRRDKPTARAEPKEDKKKLAFGKLMAGVGTTMLLGACSPDVTINNIPYDPALPDGGVCAPSSSCEERTISLREESSTAGPNTVKVLGADVTLKSVKDQNGTKAAELELEACEETASNTLTAGSSVTLTAGSRSYLVSVDTIEYDSAGVLVTVTVAPVCNDAGTPDAGVSDSG